MQKLCSSFGFRIAWCHLQTLLCCHCNLLRYTQIITIKLRCNSNKVFAKKSSSFLQRQPTHNPTQIFAQYLRGLPHIRRWLCVEADEK